MSERFAQQLPTAWTRSAVAGSPVIDGWQTELSGWGVFFARRNPERVLTEHEVRAGLTRHLVAHTAEDLVQLADQQRHLEEWLTGTASAVCPHCGRAAGEAPLIVTMDESVTAERCARSYEPSAECGHEDVEWTYQHPLPDGARCRNCDTWWRLDLIPAAVAARLTGGTPPRVDGSPPEVDRRHP